MAVRSCWKSRHKNSIGAARCWTRPGLLLVLLLFVTQFRGVSGSVGVTRVVQKDAEFDAIYSDTVTSGNQTIYAFNHTILRNKVSLKSLEYTINPGEVKVCEAEVSSHLCPIRRRECVCQWTCYHRFWRVPSCLWYGRSRLCFPSRFL